MEASFKPKDEAPEGLLERVRKRLAERGVSLPDAASVQIVGKTLSRLTGLKYSGDPLTMWNQIREFVDGPVSQGLKVREFVPLNTKRYDHVMSLIKQRE